jgi:hypothetical protein
MAGEQVRKEQGAFHEPGRADLLVGLDAPQRVPTGFMVPMREMGIEKATLSLAHSLSHLLTKIWSECPASRPFPFRQRTLRLRPA